MLGSDNTTDADLQFPGAMFAGHEDGENVFEAQIEGITGH